MTTQPTCDERIAAHLESRTRHIRDLLTVAEHFGDSTPELDETAERVEIDPTGKPADDLAEEAREQLYTLPLAVSSSRVFRIDLSTGGPADWLEVFTSGDTPNYEPAGDGEHYEVDRIVYHFSDWFDHAERALEGDEFKTAERFACQVVPELVQ